MTQATLNRTGYAKLAQVTALICMVAVVIMAWQWPDFYMAEIVKKDGKAEAGLAGTGLAENLTVLVLIIGILAAGYGLARYHRLMPDLLSKGWLFMWILACIYFAGEEASWGQWYFQWESPELFKQINDQEETNLHNMSSWFDQKPRLVVELWLLIAGFILPLIRVLRGEEESASPDSWRNWVKVPTLCLSAALFFVLVRIADWVSIETIYRFGNSEMREFSIAMFLAFYLGSYLVRLRLLAKTG